MATATQTQRTLVLKHPPILNVPNQLTASRFAMAILLFWLIAEAFWLWAALVFALAAFTDWLDGYLARKHGISSTLGRNLDPLVDKILICGTFVFLVPVVGSGVGAWVAVVIITRELLVTSLRSFMEQMGAAFGADWLGKAKMVLQCVALLYIFLHLSWAGSEAADWSSYLRDGLIYGTVAATVLSGLQYLYKAVAQLRK